MRQTAQNLGIAAGQFGLVLSSMTTVLPMGMRLFTTDDAVGSLVKSIVPLLVAVFSVHGFFCGSEGILVEQKDLTFLGRMYAAFFVVIP